MREHSIHPSRRGDAGFQRGGAGGRPLDFTHFLTALGQGPLLREAQEEVADGRKPLDAHLGGALGRLFNDYLLVGGTSQALAAYRAGEPFTRVRLVQQRILRRVDARFASVQPPSLGQRMWQVWHSLAGRLCSRNERFSARFVRPGVRESDFRPAVRRLSAMGLVLGVPTVSAFRAPMAGYKRPGMFTLYAPDTGLLAALGRAPTGRPLTPAWRRALYCQFLVEELSAANLLTYSQARRGETLWAVEYLGRVIFLARCGTTLRVKDAEDEWKAPLWAVGSLPALLRKRSQPTGPA